MTVSLTTALVRAAPPPEAATDLRHFLEAFSRLTTSVKTLEQFLVEVGRSYRAGRAKVARVTPRSRTCYLNAWRYAQLRPSFKYCEGYVYLKSCIIPVLHGWCVDEGGVVHDPSVSNREWAEYFGITFTREFAQSMWRELRTPRIAGIGILPNLYLLHEITEEVLRANIIGGAI